MLLFRIQHLQKTEIMKKLFLLCIAMIALQTVGSAQLNYVYNQRLDQVFDSVCTKFNIKGATAAIHVPNEGMWEGVHGISHDNVSINKDMYMGIGSNTKTYFAVLMLKLQEQGKLSLEDTIGQWIQHPNVSGKITIRQMLNHTSGLFSFTSSNKMNVYITPNYTQIYPVDSILTMIEAPNAAPGGAWNYSNTNYTIAGIIIKAVAGKEAYQVLRDEILQPQGLTETFFYPQEIPTGTIPHAWSTVLSSTSSMEDMIVDNNYSHNAMFSLAGTAGALMTTARDNAKFWDKLMSGKILNATSMTELETLVPVTTGQGYGLGIFSLSNFNGRPVVSHGGTNFGFINDNIHDKTNGVTITVLTNQDSISNSIILGNVISALHKVTIRYTDVTALHASQPKIQVYPNPASKKINITSEGNTFMTLYDITGKSVMSINLQNGNNKVDVSNLSSGSYYLNISKKGTSLHRQTIQVIH